MRQRYTATSRPRAGSRSSPSGCSPHRAWRKSSLKRAGRHGWNSTRCLLLCASGASCLTPSRPGCTVAPSGGYPESRRARNAVESPVDVTNRALQEPPEPRDDSTTRSRPASPGSRTSTLRRTRSDDPDEHRRLTASRPPTYPIWSTTLPRVCRPPTRSRASRTCSNGSTASIWGRSFPSSTNRPIASSRCRLTSASSASP